ncbi:MAG TPA: hypothetical protein VM433_10995 [Mycobacteriales bacterium]|nr:hypothetical protein [Mycobacteriales bacterium]
MPRRSTRRALLPVALAAALLVGGTALAAPPATPTFSTATVDPYARYDGQTRCAAVPTPGVVALQELVTSAYPAFRKGYLLRDCASGGTSEHKDGRAWDWPVHADKPEEKAAADELLAWLTEPDDNGNAHARARRLGIMYIIWNKQVFKAYGTNPGWSPYTGSNPHVDHVHFSLSWSGARQSTSWWLRTSAPTPGLAIDGDGLSLVLRSTAGSGTQRTWRPGGGFGTATGLGGSVVGGLGTAVLTDGTLVAAGRGTDDALWVNTRPPGKAWTGWLPGGGLLSTRPAVASDLAGGFDVAVRGADGRTWLTSFDAGLKQGGWASAGGGVLEASGPGLVRSGPEVLEVVVLGTDGGPWRRTRAGSTWTPWSRLGGAAKGDVGLAPSASGPVLAVRGPDDRTYVQRMRPTGDAGWTALGGALSSAPSVAATTGSDRADVVVHGTDGKLYRATGAGTAWSGWTELR